MVSSDFSTFSLTFPWPFSNSPTFPGFPGKWSPCLISLLFHCYCKNGWTDRDAVWDTVLSGSKEACTKWGGGEHWRHLANMTRSSMCGGNTAFLSDYSDRLLIYCGVCLPRGVYKSWTRDVSWSRVLSISQATSVTCSVHLSQTKQQEHSGWALLEHDSSGDSGHNSITLDDDDNDNNDDVSLHLRQLIVSVTQFIIGVQQTWQHPGTHTVHAL